MGNFNDFARIVEQHQIVRVQSDGPVFFAFVVMILTDVYYAGFS